MKTFAEVFDADGAPTADVVQLRQPGPLARLAEVGFAQYVLPAIPINATLAATSRVARGDRGKVPGKRKRDGTWTGWPKWTDTAEQLSAESIKKYDVIDCGTCVRTGAVVGVDLDITAARLVEAVEQAAVRVMGPAPRRGRSNSARRLLPYRIATPLKKIKLTFARGFEEHAVEILGQGQQFVAYGQHPSGVSYEWTRGDLCELGFAGLIPVTKEQIDAFLAGVTQIMAGAGFKIEKSGAGNSTGGGNNTRGDGKAIGDPSLMGDPELVESALAALGNGDDVDYGEWMTRVHAVKAALGGDEEHYSIYEEWCLLYPQNDPEIARAKWDSIHESTVGADYLYEMARLAGWPRWAEASGFEAVDEPPPADLGAGDRAQSEDAAPPKQPTTDVPAWIEALNQHHATVSEFGKPVVYTFRPIAGDRHRKIERVTYDDFAKLGEHDKLTIEWNDGGKVKSKTMPRNLAWRHHSQHRHYNEVVFEPGQAVSAGTLNLWQGWPVDPAPGDWSMMRAHIRDVICEGDEVRDAYAIRWLAWKVQNPGGRPEVAFTIHGPKGTGKGRFAHWYGRLFGEHRVTAKHRDEVLGRFNNHLHHCALLVAEEAFFARDPTVDGPLKVMITEPDYRVEFKFGASVRVPNKLAIMMLSNHDSVVPATADERRYFVTRVSSAKIRDFAYFNALDKQMENGGLAAMLHDLLTMDLTDFNIRDVPNTAALKEQKRHAAKGVEAWLWDVLEEGRIPGDYGGTDWTDTGLETAKDRLHKTYRETDKPHPLAESIFAKKLVEILGGAVASSRPTIDNTRVRSWKFAPLMACRAAFEKHMNVAGYGWPKC